MLNKKVPLRMCIVCKESKAKTDLVRIVKNADSIRLDKTGKLGGRGAYVCNDTLCFDKLCKQKILNKAFKQNVSQEIYDSLKEQFFEDRQD